MEQRVPNRAVLDFETTGLSPKRRAVEVAIVVSTADGDVVDRYETMINPQRPVGPSESIHGLSDLELREAPTFKEIAADVLRLIEGNVIVAHNLPFDWVTLADEFERCGVQFPSISGWCTSKLASKAMGFAGRSPKVRLGVACSHFGIRNAWAHSAAGDAEATRQLFEAVNSVVSLPPARTVATCSNGLRLPRSVRPLPRVES